MSINIDAGATSRTIDVFLQDSSSTTGDGLAGLVYNTTDLICYYRKGATGTSTAISLAIQTVGGAWSSGGFKEIDATGQKGMYRFDIPNAVIDTEGFAHLLFSGAADLVATPIRINCTSTSVNIGAVLGTDLTETSSGNLADNLSFFYDKDTTTTKTVDDVGGGLDAAGIRTALGMASADLDTQLDALPTASEINTAVDTALSDIGLDHLLSTSVTGTDVANNSIFAQLVSASATADWDDYDNENMSLQNLFSQFSSFSGTVISNQGTIIFDIGDIQTDVTTILGDTNELQTNQGDWATATGFSTFNAATDTVDLGKIIGTALSESNAGDLANNITKFFDVNPTTANTVDDVGGGSGLDAAATRAAIGLSSANLDTQLADIPTVTEFEARTLVAAAYFDPTTDAVANVTLVATTTTNTDMIAAAGIRTAVGLATANLDTQLADIPTVAEFEARTIAADDYFDPATDAVANVTLVATTTTNTDMISAAGIRAAVGLSFADLDTQLADIPTVAEFEARTIAAAAYFDPATDAVANVTLVATTTTNTDMITAVGIRSAVGLATANLDTQLADIPTVAEFEARTIVAANYFDPATDAVANVTLVGTTTTNTDMITATDIRSAVGLSSADLDTQLADIPTVAEFESRTLVAAAYFDPAADTVDIGKILGTAITETSAGNLADNISFFYDLDVTTTKTAADVGGGSSGLTASETRAALGLSSANLDTQLADIPTVAEFEARTIAAASYFDPTTDAVANVTLVATTTTNTDMITAAGIRSALGLSSADLDTQLADIPTVAEFEARTIVAAAYFDPATDAVANVTLVATTTTNTDKVSAADIQTAVGLSSANLDTQLADIPTVAEFEARTIAADDYFDVASDMVAVGAFLSTALSESNEGDLANNVSYFFDVNPTTTKTVDDIGAGGGMDAAATRAALGLSSANLDTQLADIPTVAEFEARTLVAANYFDPTTDAVANVTLVATTTTNTDMLSAADVRSALGLSSADLDTQLADLPTVAEFEARTIVAAAYFDPATDAVANVTLVDTTTTNTDMITAAGIRSAVGLSSADLDTQLADIPTVAEFEARTLVAAAYFDPTADTVANVTLVGTTTTNTDMISAAGVRTALGLSSANLDTQLADIPTVAEFEARTITADDYFDPAADAVANVTLVDTTTTNTDMISAAGIRSAVGLSSADLDTQLADIPTVAEFEARTIVAANYFDPAADTVVVGTNNDKTGYSISGVLTTLDDLENISTGEVDTALATYDGPTKAEMNDAFTALAVVGNSTWTTATGFSTHSAADVVNYDLGDGRTMAESLYQLRNKVEIVAGVMSVYETDDTTVAYTMTVTTAPGNPISAVDPV